MIGDYRSRKCGSRERGACEIAALAKKVVITINN